MDPTSALGVFKDLAPLIAELSSHFKTAGKERRNELSEAATALQNAIYATRMVMEESGIVDPRKSPSDVSDIERFIFTISFDRRYTLMSDWLSAFLAFQRAGFQNSELPLILRDKADFWHFPERYFHTPAAFERIQTLEFLQRQSDELMTLIGVNV